jgi:hypothetical protein
VLVRKEFRATVWPWLAILAAMVSGVPFSRDLFHLAPVFYVFGALGLGANAIGHEYRHGTLAQLLTQPVPRSRILAAKMIVLAALLVAVTGMAAIVVFPQFRWRPADRDFLAALCVLPPLYGLLVAPWLTLKTRSTLAGMLFSGALAALLVIAGDWIGTLRFASDREIDAFKVTVLWIGSALLFVAGTAALWRSFLRLDVIEGVRADIALPAPLRVARASTPVRRNPFLLLAAKEVRLQQLTFVASLMYCLLFVTLWARRGTWVHYHDGIEVATAIHGIIVATLAGALCCAEERALGTLQWQLLQPVAARIQFAVKIGITAALVFGLALGLPAVLGLAAGFPTDGLIQARTAFTLLLLLVGSIYLSSVAGSSLIAFFACVPAFMISFWFAINVAGGIGLRVFGLFHRMPRGQMARGLHTVPDGVATLIWSVFILLTLAFAFVNYRDSDRSLGRAGGQLLGLAALLVVTFAGFAAVGRLL